MELKVRAVGSVTVVDLTGQLTIGRGELLLRQRISDLLEREQKRILLNLEQVGYMDSAGIGELVACSERARARDGCVKLLRPSPKILELLRITRFADLFESYDDESEALGSF